MHTYNKDARRYIYVNFRRKTIEITSGWILHQIRPKSIGLSVVNKAQERQIPLLVRRELCTKVANTGQIPLLVRRGGCGIDKKLRSHRSAADGVVTHKFHFTNAF